MLREWNVRGGAYSIAVGGTCRRGRVALCGLDVRRWTKVKNEGLNRKFLLIIACEFVIPLLNLRLLLPLDCKSLMIAHSGILKCF